MLRVMDAPGYYAAFPWGVTRGKRGRPERAATPLAHALYIPLSLSPASSTPGRLFGHGGDSPSSTPRASTGAFRRGGQFSTRANLDHASNTKGPLRRKNIHAASSVDYSPPTPGCRRPHQRWYRRQCRRRHRNRRRCRRWCRRRRLLLLLTAVFLLRLLAAARYL